METNIHKILSEIRDLCEYTVNAPFLGVYDDREAGERDLAAFEAKKDLAREVLAYISELPSKALEKGVVALYNARYENQDYAAWRLAGIAFGHPTYDPGEKLYPSSPVKFDEEHDLLTTFSGRTYKIMSYAYGKRDETIAEIRKTMKEKGL